jgi:hypothetical protein
MKAPAKLMLFLSILLATTGTTPGQTPPPTVDGYLGAAKIAAGTDWAGTFLRMCIPPPAEAAPASGGRQTIAESARGIAPRAAHRTGRKPLDLSGSCHPLEAAASHWNPQVLPVAR